MGIMWNRHYVSFCFIRDTYTEEIVVIDKTYNNRSGSNGGSRGGVVFINDERVTFHINRDASKGDTVTIWYSPKGTPNINAFVKKEGEQLIDLQKHLMKNFLNLF